MTPILPWKNSCTERLVFGKRAAQKADRGRTAERTITWISCSFGYRIDIDVGGDELLLPSEDQIVTMIRRDPTSALMRRGRAIPKTDMKCSSIRQANCGK
jgi:hypothetical protein